MQVWHAQLTLAAHHLRNAALHQGSSDNAKFLKALSKLQNFAIYFDKNSIFFFVNVWTNFFMKSKDHVEKSTTIGLLFPLRVLYNFESLQKTIGNHCSEPLSRVAASIFKDKYFAIYLLKAVH